MHESLSLPMPLHELPQSIQRFCNSEGPRPARMMAAKGLVPVKGHDLVIMLLQLANDGDEEIAQTASKAFDSLPNKVVQAAAKSELPKAILHGLAKQRSSDWELVELIVSNASAHNETVDRIAKTAPEQVCERIASNEQRLLSFPSIIESLYHNPKMRMSTADRLIALAVRNKVRLDGIPTYDSHAQAIANQLIIEPTDEALPSDNDFQAVLEADSDDAEIVTTDEKDGTEKIKSRYIPLSTRIAGLAPSEKLRLAVIGNAAARAILVRDPQKQVALAAITSPRVKEREAAVIAMSREVSEDVLRYIGTKREWLRNYEVKYALVFNPKAPYSVALQFVTHLREFDLKRLAKSRNVPAAIRSTASRLVKKKTTPGTKA